MWKYNYSDELYHHGVKGMKWGVRKKRITSGLQKLGMRQAHSRAGQLGVKAGAKIANKKVKKSRKADVKNRRNLSDAELKKKVERLKMEKQLKDLTADDISPGKKFVAGIMSSSGKKVATAFATGAALYGTKAAMTGEFNIKDLAGYMTPKPKK